MTIFKNAFICLLLLFCLPAYADDDFEWTVVVKDKQQSIPIEGAKVTFSFEDKKDGRTWDEACLSNTAGICKIVATAKSGVFYVAKIEWHVRWEKFGYTPESTYTTKTINNTHRISTFLMTSDEYAEKQVHEAEAARQREDEQRRHVVEEKLKLEKQLAEASEKSTVTCLNKNACDKMFSLAEVYIVKTSDMKIQLATGNTIQTYNPTEEGKMSVSAVKIPGKGSNSTITVSVNCKNDSDLSTLVCLQKQVMALEGFKPFVAGMYKE